MAVGTHLLLRSFSSPPPSLYDQEAPNQDMGAEQFPKSNSSDRSLNCYVDAHKTQKNAFWRPKVSQNRIETRF